MVGKILCDRYQIIQIINQGMFCQTYIARDITLTDFPTCVVKHFLPSDRITLPVKIRRRLFTREVEALTKLGSYEYVPHLLNHFEYNQEFYLVQEFIKGHCLSAELQPGKPWAETQVIELLQEVLGILDFVHSQGLIHRDVKPSNIMRRDRDNRLLLIDFGAVKPICNQLLEEQRNAFKLNKTASTTIAIGTPGYMPYEQHQGRPIPSSDIYALGIIGIQALTGVHPLELPEDQNSGELAWEHLVDIDNDLAAVINQMVSYHSKNRYKSATEALAALMLLTDLSSVKAIRKTSVAITDTDEVLTSPSSTLLQQKNSEVYQASESDTIISVFPHKSALFIGLVIGLVSGLALMVLSFLSIQTIRVTPEMQNIQMQKQPSR